jgi:hypothetical protein
MDIGMMGLKECEKVLAIYPPVLSFKLRGVYPNVHKSKHPNVLIPQL